MVIKEIRKHKEGQKKAAVIRYGAWGDSILISPVFRALKADGYHITFNCTERCYELLKTNPHIDRFWVQDTNAIPIEELPEFWEKIRPLFDRWVNLSGSIEGQLLVTPKQVEYTWSKEDRHKKYNVNYMDHTMTLAGYPEKKGELPDIHFKAKEEEWAKQLRQKYQGKYLVAVSMTGSSVHKIYPWMGDVVTAITSALPNAHVLLLGEGGAKGIIDESPQITDMCGDVGIRKSCIITKYADLVITTETSLANAVSCFDTPKVVLLSHSSHENLTKYWLNCWPVFQPVSCYPCHQLHYTKETCRLDTDIELPICASLLSPKKVLDAVQEAYQKYLNKFNRSYVTKES